MFFTERNLDVRLAWLHGCNYFSFFTQISVVFRTGLMEYSLDISELDLSLNRFRLNAWLQDTACIQTSWSFSQNHKHLYLSAAGCFSFSHFLSPDRPSSPRFFSFQRVPRASHDRYSQYERNHEPAEMLCKNYEKEEAVIFILCTDIKAGISLNCLWLRDVSGGVRIDCKSDWIPLLEI